MANGLTREEKIQAILQAQSVKKQPAEAPSTLTREEKIQAILEIQKEKDSQENLRRATTYGLAVPEGLIPFLPTEVASYGSGIWQKAGSLILENQFQEQLRQKGITEEFPVSNEPSFSDFVNQARQQYKAGKEEFPSAMAIELATGLVSPTGKLKQAAETFATTRKVPKVVAKIPELAAKAAEKVSKGFDVASGLGQKIPGLQAAELAADAGKLAKYAEYGKTVGRMAAGGAVAGAGAAGLKTITDLSEAATGGRELPSLGELGEQAGQFALGGAAVGTAIPPVISTANTVLKYTIPVVLGPGKPEAVERFITKGREKRQTGGYFTETGPGSLSMTSKDFKDLIDPVIRQIIVDIEAGKASLEDLKLSEKDALDRSKTAQLNAKGDALEKLKIQDARIREAVKYAEDIVEKRLGNQYSEKVISAADNLHQNLREESEKSYEILQNAIDETTKKPLRIDLSDLPAAINKELNSKALKLGKTEFQNNEAKKAREVLTKLLFNLKNYYRKGLRPDTVKDLLKNEIDKLIDQTTDRRNTAEFSNAASNALLSIRRHIDQKIKSHKPYAEQMQYVNALQELRKTLSKKILGYEDTKVLPSVRRITEANSDEFKTLFALQELTGIDLLPDLEIFMAYKNKTPMEVLAGLAQRRGLLENDPTYQEAFNLVQDYKIIERLPETEYQKAVEFINPEQQSNLAAIREAKAAKEQEVIKLQKELDSIGGFGSVDAAGNLNNYPAIRSAVLEKNPIQQLYLENLARIAKSEDPKEFVLLIQDLKMANEFTQEFPTGARRAVMGLGLGALFGGVTGGIDAESIAIFAGLGSVLGGAADRYGVATAKALLNAYVSMTYRIPTFTRWEVALASEAIPIAIQKTILQQFAKQVQSEPDEPISVDPGRRAELYDEIKASPMDAVSKAQALDLIAKNGQVPGWAVKKMMLGVQAPSAVMVPKAQDKSLNEDRPQGVRK